MQEVPRCFTCFKPVEHDPIYEAPCGHDDHASAVFHPLCLMAWRERRDAAIEAMREYSRHVQEGFDRSDEGAA